MFFVDFFLFLSFFPFYFSSFSFTQGKNMGWEGYSKGGLEVGVHWDSGGQGAEVTAPLLPRTFIPAEVGAESQNS